MLLTIYYPQTSECAEWIRKSYEHNPDGKIKTIPQLTGRETIEYVERVLLPNGGQWISFGELAIRRIVRAILEGDIDESKVDIRFVSGYDRDKNISGNLNRGNGKLDFPDGFLCTSIEESQALMSARWDTDHSCDYDPDDPNDPGELRIVCD